MSRRGPSLGFGRALRVARDASSPWRRSLSACSGIELRRLGFGRGAVPRAVTGEMIGTGERARGAAAAALRRRQRRRRRRAAFRNAAELAMRDFPTPASRSPSTTRKGTPAGAQAAVGTALQEGAEIILGPVFSSEVSAVAPQARAAGVPVVAFSSDAGVAGPGVYLLSFLPSDDVEPHRLLFREPGAKVLRRAAAGECLRRGRRGGVPQRRRQLPAAASWRSRPIEANEADIARQGRGDRARSRRRSTRCSFPMPATSCRRSPRRSRPAASRATR